MVQLIVMFLDFGKVTLVLQLRLLARIVDLRIEVTLSDQTRSASRRRVLVHRFEVP